jgi:hypothetical protein
VSSGKTMKNYIIFHCLKLFIKKIEIKYYLNVPLIFIFFECKHSRLFVAFVAIAFAVVSCACTFAF